MLVFTPRENTRWRHRFHWPGNQRRLGSWLRNRTKAFYLRELIERGIEDLEDYYLAAEVLERIRKGEERVHSAADVRRDLALGD